MNSEHTVTTADSQARVPERIAAGVDGYPEGDDAAVLGSIIARATGAELMLVAVHPDPLVVLPAGMGWMALRRQAEALLRRTRDEVAPGARVDVETDWSVPRALERVVRSHHRDLLILGSSRRGRNGQVEIGSRTRQLLGHSVCALAVAPRGFSDAKPGSLKRIGVGYDGGPEAGAALSLAAAIARAAGARLRVEAVVDDRLPSVGALPFADAAVAEAWETVLEPEVERLLAEAQTAVESLAADAEVQARLGTPAAILQELTEKVDLMVIGSRRWGSVARVLLGGTGEALMHGARCPVLIVPRPDDD